MNYLIGLICLSAILFVVSGQLSSLSPSYSLQGALTQTEDGTLTLGGAFSVFVDITQQLQIVDETITTTSGGFSDNLRLSSSTDSATYLRVNSVCTETAFDPNVYFPLENVWDLYAAGTENPVGTFTFTQNDITYQVIIVNGIPASFTFSFDTTVITAVVFQIRQHDTSLLHIHSPQRMLPIHL